MEGHFPKAMMNLGGGKVGGERWGGGVEKLFTVQSPEMLIYVARKFIMLNNILASLLTFAALVSSD